MDSLGSNTGNFSRVVAAGSTFYTFTPLYTADYVYTSVDMTSSSDGVSWTTPSPIAQFGAPANQSPDGTIYYGEDLQAQGYSNGLWTVVFPVNNGGYNNAYICTSNRGCGLVNAGADDEFYIGTSVSGDGGYWVTYYAYSSLNTRALPLVTQSIYFPANQNPIGATTYSGISPSGSWIQGPAGYRCPAACYVLGDYNNISSTPSASASMPVITISSLFDPAIWQQFIADPQGTPSAISFVPNFIPYSLGADLRSISLPLPQAQLGVKGKMFNRHAKPNR